MCVLEQVWLTELTGWLVHEQIGYSNSWLNDWLLADEYEPFAYLFLPPLWHEIFVVIFAADSSFHTTELSVATHTHADFVLSPPKAAIPPKHRLSKNSVGLSDCQIQVERQRRKKERQSKRKKERDGAED